MNEKWKIIPSFPAYAASNCGLIARIAPAKTRTVPYILKASIHKRDYGTVKIYGPDGKKHIVAIHRLICEAWHGPAPKDKNMACHNDGNPQNNKSDNLRWDNCKGNLADRKRHGTEMIGERNGRAKLNWVEVEKIRKEFTGKYGDYKRLSRKYNIADSQIHEIIKKQSWVNCDA